MKIKALSHYGTDVDTRFGDCIIVYDEHSLIVYDCGHEKHAQYVENYLQTHTGIVNVFIVVSHNDSDHTNGVCSFLKWLSERTKYTVKVYSHQYLKHVDAIEEKLNDGRRNRESIKAALLEVFGNIKTIIETAEGYGFLAIEAINGTQVGICSIVGPTTEEFIEVAAKAIDNREGDTIGEGEATETVMNAASVQMSCLLDDSGKLLLCGDATPDYLKSLLTYTIIQLPHHGQEEDAKAIFEKLGDDVYGKCFLISDNTGSAPNSGGSDDIVEYMKEENIGPFYNTRDGVVELPQKEGKTNLARRTFLGDMDYI